MRIRSALAADVICIVLFAIVGRRNHGEPTDLLGVADTAWPFLAGYLAGLVTSRGWRDPGGRTTGVLLWLATVVAGMVLRMVSGAGVQLSFVLVATVVLAGLLLGWRALFVLVRRARSRSGAHAAV